MLNLLLQDVNLLDSKCCGDLGDAIANLTYRITALFTGRDNVLGHVIRGFLA
jgi:hypothetical protein